MANTLGTLLLVLQAETSAFARGMGDAKTLAFTTSGEIVTSLKRVAEQMGKLKFDNAAQWKKSGEIIGGVVAGIGVAAAAASVVIVKQFAEQAKELDKLSQSYGLTIEQVSSLRVASALTHVGMEQLATGMGKLAKAAGANSPAFSTLEVQYKNADGSLRQMNPLLTDIAGKFAKMEDGTGKTALAMQLFGKSGAQMIPFLNAGSEGIARYIELAKQLGLTLTEDDVRAAEKLTETLELLELKTGGLKQQFAIGLLPALNDISTAFIQVDERGNSTAKTLGIVVGESAKILALTVNEMVAGFKELWVVFGQLNKWTGLDDEINQIDAARQRFVDAIQHPVMPPLAPRGGLTTPTFSGAGAKTKAAGEDFTGLLAAASAIFDRGNPLQQQIDKIQELQTKIYTFQISHPEAIFLNLNEAAGKLASTLALLKSDAQDAMASVEAGGWQSQKALADQIGRVMAAPSSMPEDPEKLREQYDPLYRFKQAIDFVTEARRLGYLTDRAYLQQLKAIQAQQAMERTATAPQSGIGGVAQGLGAGAGAIAADWKGVPAETAGTMIEVAHGMQNAFSTAFSSIIMGTKGVGQAFSQLGVSILGAIVDALSQMVARWIVTKLMMAVAGQSTDAAAAGMHIGLNVMVAASDAAVAAAGTLAVMSAMAPPPIPEAMAAATYATGLGYMGLAAASGGMEVDRDQMIFAHKDEKVLPARLSRGFDQIINSFRLPQAGGGHLAFASGENNYGGHTFTFHNYGATDPEETANRTMEKVKRFFKSGGVMR